MAATLSQVSITAGMAPGPVSVPGLLIGDVMLSLVFSAPGTHGGSCSAMSLDLFEAVVTVNDQIQQLSHSTVDSVGFSAVFVTFST